MLFLMKCPGHQKKEKKEGVTESRLSSFLSLFLLFCLSWFEVTWVCIWPPRALVFLPSLVVRLSVGWAPCLSSVLASQSLNAGAVRCLSSFLPCVAPSPLAPSLFPLPLPLSPICLSVVRWLFGVCLRWLNLVFSFTLFICCSSPDVIS